MIKIGIFGSGNNVEKLAKLLSQNLENNKDVVIEVLLPEDRGLFGYTETDFLDHIAKDKLDFFEENERKISAFVDKHLNVKILRNSKVVEYNYINDKHVINMYSENEQDKLIEVEYDVFIYADKIFTIGSHLNGLLEGYSLANVGSIDQMAKMNQIFSKTRSWQDAKSIVLVGNDLKTYSFAINLKETFEDLEITIINGYSDKSLPLNGETFDYASKALLKKVQNMGIKVYLNMKMIEKEIQADTELLSSITIKDMDTKENVVINTEIILITNNVKTKDMVVENLYFLNKVAKLSNAEEFPFIEVDEEFEVPSLPNFYFFHSLVDNVKKYKQTIENKEKISKQWNELSALSYVHVATVASSIMSKVHDDIDYLIPLNRKSLFINKAPLEFKGILDEKTYKETHFISSVGDIAILEERKNVTIRSGVLFKDNLKIKIAFFLDPKTFKLEDFLIENQEMDFDENDLEEEKMIKLQKREKVRMELTEMFYGFRNRNEKIFDILVKLFDVFDELFIEKINQLIINTQEKFIRSKLVKTKANSAEDKAKWSAFAFDKTTEIDNEIIKQILNKERRG